VVLVVLLLTLISGHVRRQRKFPSNRPPNIHGLVGQLFQSLPVFLVRLMGQFVLGHLDHLEFQAFPLLQPVLFLLPLPSPLVAQTVQEDPSYQESQEYLLHLIMAAEF